MVNLKIDHNEISVPEGTTIMEAAALAGIDIPKLCYLKNINEIAACRVCLVEVVGKEQLVTSCNNKVQEGLEILTNSPRVRVARKQNVQLILSQHDFKCATCVRSGNCTQDCAYCAQSCRSDADIDTYKWVDDDKLYNDNDFVNEYHLSRHCIGLSGMGFTDADIEQLAGRIRKMKETGTHLCCSIGFLTEKQAKMLKDAGLDRINHNLNSSRNYYSHICTTHTFDQRVENIHMLQRIGFEICSGGIIGMGESKEDVVDMLLELKEINPEALPINFLLPIPGTPLGDQDISGLTYEYGMKVLCLARLLVPQSDIRCAAGREVYFKGHEKELLSVVDSIFASGYLTAGGQGINDTIQTITDAGFTYEIESA